MATKVDLHKTTAADRGRMEAAKQTDSSKDTDPNAELDVQDFQKAGEQAKDTVSNAVEQVKTFLSGDTGDYQPEVSAKQEQRGNDALQSLSDDLISQEKASLPDSGSPTKTPGVVQQAQEKTAGALDYVEKQSQPQAGVKKEDPELSQLREAAADTAHDMKEAVTPSQETGKASSKESKGIMDTIKDAASSVANAIAPSGEAKEPEGGVFSRMWGKAEAAAGRLREEAREEITPPEEGSSLRSQAGFGAISSGLIPSHTQALGGPGSLVTIPRYTNTSHKGDSFVQRITQGMDAAGERIMQASDQAFGAENLGMDNAASIRDAADRHEPSYANRARK